MGGNWELHIGYTPGRSVGGPASGWMHKTCPVSTRKMWYTPEVMGAIVNITGEVV